jgi:hypothetical protein
MELRGAEMPLKNHAKLRSIDQWNSFHSMWIGKLAERLNLGPLPIRFEAKPSLKVGTNAEIDVGTVEESVSLFAGMNGYHPGDDNGGGTAVAAEPIVYAPPAPAITAEDVTFTDTDLFEVQVFSDDGWKLVAAVELVSPANKDRVDTVRTFTVKAASYLQAGVSLVVVDVVAGRSAELHNELCDLLDLPVAARWGSRSGFSVVSYRTRQDPKRPTPLTKYGKVALDVWPHAVGYGDPLPTVPLWLTPSLAVPLELEPTYTSTCAGLRIT